MSAVRGFARIGHVGVVNQVPRAGWTASVSLERLDQQIEVRRRPEPRIRLSRGARCASPKRPPLRVTNVRRDGKLVEVEYVKAGPDMLLRTQCASKTFVFCDIELLASMRRIRVG